MPTVLKHSVLIKKKRGTVRSTDQETIATENVVHYSQVPKRRGRATAKGSSGHTRWHRDQLLGRGRWRLWARVFVVISRGRNGSGKANRFRTGWFECQQALGIEAVPSCLAPDPGSDLQR